MEKDTKASDLIASHSTSEMEMRSFDEEKGQVSAFSKWSKNALLSVETRGIERVTDEERQQNTTKIWNACTFW